MRAMILFVPALVLAGACSATERHDGGSADGPRAQRSFEVGDFRSVALAGSPDVEITVGQAPSVRAEGPREALDELEIRVENGSLRIGTRRHGWFSASTRDMSGVTIHVTTPALEGASITGSGDMRVDRAEARSFDGDINGSGNLEIGALRAGEAHFSISGSGNIRAAGTAERAEVSIAGSGDARLDNLQAGNAEVRVMGSGNIRLRASGEVRGRIMGSGDVYVTGTSRCSVSTMGSGDLHCDG